MRDKSIILSGIRVEGWPSMLGVSSRPSFTAADNEAVKPHHSWLRLPFASYDLGFAFPLIEL